MIGTRYELLAGADSLRRPGGWPGHAAGGRARYPRPRVVCVVPGASQGPSHAYT